MSGCATTPEGITNYHQSTLYWGGPYQFSSPPEKIDAEVYIDVQSIYLSGTLPQKVEKAASYTVLVEEAVKKDIAAAFSIPSFIRTGSEQFIIEISKAQLVHLDFMSLQMDFNPTYKVIESKSGKVLMSKTYQVKLPFFGIKEALRKSIVGSRNDLIEAFSKPPLVSMLKSPSSDSLNGLELNVGIVYTKTTQESIKYLKKSEGLSGGFLNPAWKKDVDSKQVSAELDRIIQARFKNSNRFTTVEEALSAKSDLILVFDFQCSVAIMTGQMTSVDISSKLMDSNQQMIDSIVGSKSIKRHSWGIPDFASTRMTAFEQFSRNLDQVLRLKFASEQAGRGNRFLGEPVKVTRPEGIYRFDEEVTFNVLDSISIDPETGQLSFLGHFDSRYSGPRIPYLQHLAAFLNNPKPQFSLEWTPESERKIDEFFERMDDPSAMEAFGSDLGKWLTPDGAPTRLGRQMLPLIGVMPTKNGAALGYLGMEVAGTGDWYLDVVRVVPGSPAAQAGFLAGDSIALVNRFQIWHPIDFVREVQRTGAGGTLEISGTTPGVGFRKVDIVLGKASGDPWKTIDRYDILAALLRGNDMEKGAQIIEAATRIMRIKDSKYYAMAMEGLIFATDQYDNRELLTKRFNRGELSDGQWRTLVLRSMTEAIEDTFRIPSGVLTSVFDAEINRGIPRATAFGNVFINMEPYILEISEEALRTIFSRQDEVLIPASMAESHLGISPQVKPTYIGLASDTLLARLMFESDYLGKTLIEMPLLSDRIPNYKTQFVYYGDNPTERSPMGESVTERLWISIDQVALTQSKDGETLFVGDVDMRFNIASEVGSSSGGYDDYLTSMYDDLSLEFPILHELSEAAKLSAASRWLLARWPDFRLPANGQSRWEGPEVLDGVVYLMWDPKGSRVQIAAVGGVSMVPPVGPSGPVNPMNVSEAIPTDTSVVDLSESDLTVIPQRYNNTALSRVLSPITEVPVPRPVGWVRRANKGDRTLKALNVVVPEESTSCNEETWVNLNEKLDSVRMTARQLASVENAINAISDQSPARQAEFVALEQDLIEARQEFIDQSIDIISQGLLDSKDMVRNQSATLGIDSLSDNVEAMYQANEILSDTEGKLKKLSLAQRIAQADTIEERNQAVEDLFKYAEGLFESGADIKGSDKLSRLLRNAGKKFKRLNKIKSTLDYGKTLLTLGEASGRMQTLGSQTEKDSQELRDSLLPLQRKLSDQLDAELKDPLVQKWMNGRAKVDC